jgi:hypothetical protein
MTRPRILIAGNIETHPICGGGNTWAFLQYVLGFRRLGFDTYYVEELDRQQCIDQEWRRICFTDSINARHFRTFIERFDLHGHAALLERGGPGHVGLSLCDVEKIARDIDLLINLSGSLQLKSVLGAVRRRMYVDLDPGYTQIWHEQYGVDMNLHGHDVYVTVGLNLGNSDCPFPTCGIRWEKTLPPVVLDDWTAERPAGNVYSTIAEWRGFGAIEWRGVWYGQKADEFRRLMALPGLVNVPLELCLFIHPDDPDRRELEESGWRLVSPYQHAMSTDSYRDYIFASRGEVTAVKQGYAIGRTGWFSDRAACYLAAGRPVIVQDTGIGTYVPTGTGLLSFADIDGAAEAINRVENDYSRHAAAAASFAGDFLHSDLVLGRLLRLAGI